MLNVPTLLYEFKANIHASLNSIAYHRWLSFMMKNYFTTERLKLGPLVYKNATFILKLLNTDGWLKFIGERNVKNLTDSRAYIRKIKNLPNVKYWVVYIKDQGTPIGIITFIKRDYLDQPDIGFAFLPAFTKSGYASEAAEAVLESLHTNEGIDSILATTLSDNSPSVALLRKLGFHFENQLAFDGTKLLLYKLDFSPTGS